MRIVLVHNFHQYAGGEGHLFTAQAALLRRHGHEVFEYTDSNENLIDQSHFTTAGEVVWSQRSKNNLFELLNSVNPQVAHFHNTFFRISPSVYYACKEASVPIVQTVHNFRIFCPIGTFLRDGKVCEECLGRGQIWHSVRYACFRNSRLQTSVVAAMLVFHRTIQTWTKSVDLYIALTKFARKKLIEGGIPKEKIVLSPTFIDPDLGAGNGEEGYALFVGRLASEKGISTLLSAWDKVGGTFPLKIVGVGPLAGRVEEAVRRLRGVEWLGRQPKDRVQALMKDATFLILPSIWYENLPAVIVEAFSAGLPVIASNLGSMSFLVEHGCTGLHFRPGDPDDLISQVQWALEHPNEINTMRHRARAKFESEYTAERHYQSLMEIYSQVIR